MASIGPALRPWIGQAVNGHSKKKSIDCHIWSLHAVLLVRKGLINTYEQTWSLAKTLARCKILAKEMARRSRQKCESDMCALLGWRNWLFVNEARNPTGAQKFHCLNACLSVRRFSRKRFGLDGWHFLWSIEPSIITPRQTRLQLVQDCSNPQRPGYNLQDSISRVS